MSLKIWIKNTHQKNISFTKEKIKARWFSVITILLIVCFYIIVQSISPLFIYVSVGYFLLCLVIPALVIPVLYPWMWFGSVMGEIVSLVFLAVVYYIILFPVSLFVKKKSYNSGWTIKDTFTSKEKLY